jgi:type II secretory pathway pseudopilin PulG
MNRIKKIPGNNAGHSLVEVLVSGILLVFAVTAAVAVVGTGTQLTASDNDRRQARAVIRTVFEQSYDYRDFNVIPVNGTTTEEVLIDERMGLPLTGHLTKTVTEETIGTNSGTPLTVKKVNLSLCWTSPEGIADSISFTKIVARAR